MCTHCTYRRVREDSENGEIPQNPNTAPSEPECSPAFCGNLGNSEVVPHHPDTTTPTRPKRGTRHRSPPPVDYSLLPPKRTATRRLFYLGVEIRSGPIVKMAKIAKMKTPNPSRIPLMAQNGQVDQNGPPSSEPPYHPSTPHHQPKAGGPNGSPEPTHQTNREQSFTNN